MTKLHAIKAEVNLSQIEEALSYLVSQKWTKNRIRSDIISINSFCKTQRGSKIECPSVTPLDDALSYYHTGKADDPGVICILASIEVIQYSSTSLQQYSN